MRLAEYIRDNLAKVVIYAAMGLLVAGVLAVFGVDEAAVGCILGVLTVFGLVLFFYDFVRKRRFYFELEELLSRLDKKYLLSELIEAPGFLEGQKLYKVLEGTDKATAEEIGEYRRQVENFRDYIELWVHEIKTPLAGLSLSLRGETRAVKIYLEEMENYIDQALFYSKIDVAEKDYVVKRVALQQVVNNVVRRNKDNLIKHKVHVETSGLARYVHSDAKWLEFILNQVVSNAIKYRGARPGMRISAAEGAAGIVLKIWDNGMGIKKSELRKVFKKGFTGSNDRRAKVSTGMGLYISNELAKGLGHSMKISSEVGEFTEVEIGFGANDFYLTKL